MPTPNKVLSGRASSVAGYSFWNQTNDDKDIFKEEGLSPRSFQWEIELSINRTINSGYDSSYQSNEYSGIDIVVGQWVADTVNGLAVEIVDIIDQDSGYIKCIVEDVNRYNTFNSQLGIGIFDQNSYVIVFGLSDYYNPIIQPLPEK